MELIIAEIMKRVLSSVAILSTVPIWTTSGGNKKPIAIPNCKITRSSLELFLGIF